MKISKKEDYGLIFMSALARKYSKEFISLAIVAKETRLSPLFLKHMASLLLKNGLIDSKEGITGGYRLSRDPRKINVAQILESLSEGMVIPSCKTHNCTIKKDKCVCFSLWDKVNNNVFSYLRNIKLSDFAKRKI